jgi:hypothetical protein
VFKDALSLDLHQAEYHNKKVALRIAHKEDNEEEEDKKVPTITPQQYKRMNEQRNEHFPTLEGVNKVYVPVDEERKDSKLKKSKDGHRNGPG